MAEPERVMSLQEMQAFLVAWKPPRGWKKEVCLSCEHHVFVVLCFSEVYGLYVYRFGALYKPSELLKALDDMEGVARRFMAEHEDSGTMFKEVDIPPPARKG